MIYDIAIVGAGILGLAHAKAASDRGLRVVVIDRDHCATGASIRNFGFVTVTGQEAGECWRLAVRSRDVWQEVVAAAKIPVLQRGLTVAARRPQSEAVIDSFLKTEMGESCRRLTFDEARTFVPMLSDRVTAALHSPHELRVESREAIPQLTRWLSEARGVTFRWGEQVLDVAPPAIRTSGGLLQAGAVILCPGDSYAGPFGGRLTPSNLTRCKLHMLRIKPESAVRLETALMSDLGLARYLGYATLPEAVPLKALLDREQPVVSRDVV